MVKRARHIGTRLVALLLAANIFCLPIFFVASVSAIKKMQRKLLRELTSPVETFVFSEPQYTTLCFIGDDEMLYKGMMYDIKSIKKEGNSYIVQALADEKETDFQKKDLQNKKRNKRQGKRVLILFSQLGSKKIATQFSLVVEGYINFYMQKLQWCFVKIPYPPPEF